jgi:hypothetical protein
MHFYSMPSFLTVILSSPLIAYSLNQYLVFHKKVGPAQNILEPVCKRTGHYPAINGCSNSQHATISATEILSPHKYFFCPLSNQIFSIASKVLCILSQYLATSFESSGFPLRKGIKNLDCGNQKKVN